MTNEQKRMLRVVAAYNDITEEQAEKAIVEDFLNWLLKDDSNPLSNMELKVEKPESPKAEKPSVKDLINQALKEAGTVEEIQLLAATRRELSELGRRRKEQAAELETKDETPEPKAAFRPLPEKIEPAPLPDFDPAIETPEQPKIRKKPGRKPKTLKEFVDGTAREVRQAEKMSKDEFVEYFGGKG